ncbi:MAG: hypothetical protein CVU25_05745, partial [Betaproteobacteria bacterium HGW-Betaproteobacteria-19]
MPKARLLAAATVLAAMALPGITYASCSNKNYGIDLLVENFELESTERGVRCANTAESFFDLLSDSGFSSIVSNYDEAAIAAGQVSFNGLPMLVDFESTGPELRFRVPELGIDVRFEGSDRDASADLLVDYIKKSGILSRIVKYQAENTPNSPITGPGGMIPSAAATDFDAALSDTMREIRGGGDADSPTLSLGASWGSMNLDGKK